MKPVNHNSPVEPEPGSGSPARAGDEVVVHYTTRTPDGAVVESSRNREPFRFRLGRDEVVPGLETMLVGMREGERKTVSVPPDHAFGLSNPDLRHSVPVAMLPAGVETEAQLATEVGGEKLDLWLVARTEMGAVLDANHPLAGCTLVYDIELVSVDSDPSEAPSGEELPCPSN